MSPRTYHIGLALYNLEVSTSGKQSTSRERATLPLSSAQLTHWALVFARKGRSLKVELLPKPMFSGFTIEVNPKEKITYAITEYDYELDAHYFGTYIGEESDLRRLAETHSMNGKEYSKTFNNCQHWVARYLGSLFQWANNSSIQELEMYEEDEEAEKTVDTIVAVLVKGSKPVKNKPNKFIADGTTLAVTVVGSLLLMALE